ncbi:MAG: putative nucleotidyltransferase substrate binding domain-containing protein [Cyclonatronaceae bacterium]
MSRIFFDFKCGYGNPEFRRALRQHLREMLAERADLFFYHLAQNAMDNAIPLGFFGGFKYPAKEGLDLKKAMLPAVNYARLYALRHHIHHPNTLRRLHELNAAGALPAQQLEQLCATYSFMMEVRLRHQLSLLQSNRPPDNAIIPEQLPEETQKRLKKALKEMKALQQHLRLEYSSGY